MGWTQDCGTQISREHFISASVLAHFSGKNVKVHGLPWLVGDQTKILPIRSLTGNILCRRHNEAFSGLDAEAGKFFTTMAEIHRDVLDKKTLSRRRKWYLFSGEDDLELWLLKTAMGFFHSGNAERNKIKLSATQKVHPECYNILLGSTFPSPCGLYVEPIHLSQQLNQLQFAPISDDASQGLVGFHINHLSFALILLFDPNATYDPRATASKTYRPSYLIVKNPKRTHTIMLTWPPTTSIMHGVVQASF
jgi:hypothetical protein